MLGELPPDGPSTVRSTPGIRHQHCVRSEGGHNVLRSTISRQSSCCCSHRCSWPQRRWLVFRALTDFKTWSCLHLHHTSPRALVQDVLQGSDCCLHQQQLVGQLSHFAAPWQLMLLSPPPRIRCTNVLPEGW